MADTTDSQQWADVELRLHFRQLAQRARQARDRLGGEICIPLYHADALALIWLDEHLSDIERVPAKS